MIKRSFLNCLMVFFLTVPLFSVKSEATCTESDRTELYKENHTFAERWRSCSSLCGLDTDCMNDFYSEMSTDCIGCFASMTSCVVRNCKKKCAPSPIGYGQKSIECKDCSERNCGADMALCTGVSIDQIPDFKR